MTLGLNLRASGAHDPKFTRLLNEGSHGPTPENSLRTEIDPETIPVAKKILQLLQKDSEQYSAFMESIS